MAVPDQNPFNVYTANGVTTVFPYGFYIIDVGDLTVSLDGEAVSTGFTVTGIGNVNGGEVTFLTPPAIDVTVMLERVVAPVRLTEYQDNGDLLADTVNLDFDRLWMAIKQSFVSLGVALLRPVFGGPFNAKGYRIANLSDPVNDQDAATKKWTQSQGFDLYAKTLRFDDSFIDPLPPLSQLEGKILAVSCGKPVGVLPGSGSASDVMIQLASINGDKMVGAFAGGTVYSDYQPSKYRRKGSFGSGAILSNSFDVVLYPTNGMWYVYTGTPPHSATESAPDANYKCVGLLNFDINTIENFGGIGDGVADDFPAFDRARASLGAGAVLRLSAGKTYYFAGVRRDLSGINIYTEQGATIKTDENPNTKTMNLINSVIIDNPVHVTTLRKPANNLQSPELWNFSAALSQMNVNEKSSMVDMTSWLQKVYVYTTGDISTTNGTATMTSRQGTWSAAFNANPQVLYSSAINNGSLYELNYYSSAGTNAAGIFIKSATHIWSIYAVVGLAEIQIRKRDLTGTIVENTQISPPNGGAYGWLTQEEANIGFVKDASGVTLVVSGLPLYRVDVVATDVGFIVNPSADTVKVRMHDLIETTNYSLRVKKPMKIAVVGDSIMYGAWSTIAIEKMLPIALQNTNVAGDISVTNYAVSGYATAQWVPIINSTDLTGHALTLVMLGTNDQQAGVSVSTYIANITTIANAIVAQGSKPIFGIFPIYTQTSISGVVGVTTTNYARHAKYTHALKKFCVENGYEFADVRRAIGANLTWYGDNIHPTSHGHVAITAAWVEAINKSLKFNAWFH